MDKDDCFERIITENTVLYENTKGRKRRVYEGNALFSKLEQIYTDDISANKEVEISTSALQLFNLHRTSRPLNFGGREVVYLDDALNAIKQAQTAARANQQAPAIPLLPTIEESDAEAERMADLFVDEKAPRYRNFILGFRECAGYFRTFKKK